MESYRYLILAIYLLEKLFGYILTGLNTGHLRRHNSLPPEFEGKIEPGTLRRMQDYSAAKSRFGIIHSLFNIILIVAFLFTPLFSIYNNWIVSLNLPFVAQGLLFFALLAVANTLLGIPFDLYETFKLEAKYGFNTTTSRLWLTDLLKSLLLSLILGGALGSVALVIVRHSPHFWWLILWIFFFVFSLFITVIYPYVIEPLFNKVTPLEDAELNEKISALINQTGIRVERVFQIDASKRSKHVNAYFTGIGKVKRIVLFDTLLEKLTPEEILAVLAHEAGHWKLRHVLIRTLTSELFSLLGFYIFFRVLEWSPAVRLFGLTATSFPAEAVVLAFIVGLFSFFFTPVSAFFSRFQERQADNYAARLTGEGNHLADALIKLSVDNLSNLYPHPFYWRWYYSHPPVLERIKALRANPKQG